LVNSNSEGALTWSVRVVSCGLHFLWLTFSLHM